jgi:hypothetical protein
MTESNNTAGHRMPNFIDTRTDWRLDMFATLRVGKPLPIAPSLNHENPQTSEKVRSSNATSNHSFRWVNWRC